MRQGPADAVGRHNGSNRCLRHPGHGSGIHSALQRQGPANAVSRHNGSNRWPPPSWARKRSATARSREAGTCRRRRQTQRQQQMPPPSWAREWDFTALCNGRDLQTPSADTTAATDGLRHPGHGSALQRQAAVRQGPANAVSRHNGSNRWPPPSWAREWDFTALCNGRDLQTPSADTTDASAILGTGALCNGTQP